jgi:hypothetical protein
MSGGLRYNDDQSRRNYLHRSSRQLGAQRAGTHTFKYRITDRPLKVQKVMSGMDWFYEYQEFLVKYTVPFHDIEHSHGFHP